MLIRTLLSLTLMIVALTACQPMPAVPAAATMPEQAAGAPAATSEPAAGDALTLTVETAEVVVGVGSPIPVDVVITGTLPDTCTQIGSIHQFVEGFAITTTVNTFTPGLNDCIIDPIPFRVAMPVNTIQLPAGEYTITVNDTVTTTFTMPIAQAAPADLRSIPVSDVTVDVGVGSPIPVDVFVSGEWPDLCAQLAEVRQRIEGNVFEITLVATAADPDCPPDYLGLPFRIAIPINVVELPEGAYTVSVNGVSAAFDIPVTPPASESAGEELAHYQGPNPYRPLPAFDVAYDPATWEYVEDDGSGRTSQLKHRELSGCSIWLRAGPMGATAVSTANLAGYDWTIFSNGPDILFYSLPHEDITFIFGLMLPEAYVEGVTGPCQAAAEGVIGTFQIIP